MTTQTDTLDLARRLLEAAGKATAGEWFHIKGELVSHDAIGVQEWAVRPQLISTSDPDEWGRTAPVINDAEDMEPDDLAFIALSRTAAPVLAQYALDASAEIERRNGLIERLLEELRLIRMKDSNAVYDTTIRIEARTALKES